MRSLLLCLFLFISVRALSQADPPVKAGKVSAEELAKTSYAIDTDASAVIIADIGSSKIIGNNKGWFSLEYRFYRRIHILKKEAFDWATVKIPLYTLENDEESMRDLRAVTYNLENGKVVESKLNAKTEVFAEKKNKHTLIRKFTLPNVKEGSVIEYSYTIKSDFLFNIQPWNFQGEVPRLWSEYTVSLPPFLNYMLISQISRPFIVDEVKDKRETYLVEVKRQIDGLYNKTDRLNISCTVTNFRWAMNNVPAFHTEAFTSSPLNYLERLEFQLSGYLEPLEEQKILTTWPDMAKELLKRDDFGAGLSNLNGIWPDELDRELQRVSTETERAKTVFAYVRDRFSCSDHYQLYMEESLKKVADKKSGGVAEINLLLTAFLKHTGLQADPVILSSRGNMFVNERYPVASRFNYVITRVIADGKEYLLDASYPLIGFGKLPSVCYNGNARLMDSTARTISLKPEMNTEVTNTKFEFTAASAGSWQGQVIRQCGYFQSVEFRQQLSGGKTDELLKTLRESYSNGQSFSDMKADSVRNYEHPVQLQFLCKWEHDTSGRIYFSPVLENKWKQHPFKSTNRQYPVELPYCIQDSYSVSLAIPDGYTVEEMPRQSIYKLSNRGDVIFEYRITQATGKLQMSYRLDVKRAHFESEEYEQLRDFFAMVSAKLEEQVVLKKK
jgi:Domain of Unknown Function with PDB structure (DUF3857)/Domain of Unknown Function with PDB structure (DUF3858)